MRTPKGRRSKVATAPQMACAIRIREIDVGNAEGDISALAEDDASGAIEIDEEVFEEG
jgi:hypothetical protein